MRIPRFYCPNLASKQTEVELPVAVHRHVVQVLRLKSGEKISLFDGKGIEFQAQLSTVEKRTSTATLESQLPSEVPSPLSITLLQSISKGDRMDYAIQKAVEMGVQAIVPVMSERGNVQLNKERMAKKWDHWQGVVISACEQSGRNVLPELASVMTLQQAAITYPGGYVLEPTATSTIKTLALDDTVTIAIGPEGGFSDNDIEQLKQQGYKSIQFGPRILRTETATVAVISALQTLWGDIA